MSDVWFLLGLVLLAIPISAVAGLVLGLQGRARTRTLELRVMTLEREIARMRETPRQETPKAETPTPAAAPAAAREIPKPALAAVPPASAPKPAARPQRSLEERIGARWSVIVGGLALALGGIFLVRYSIEQGWIGPAARVALGALFAAGLLGLGEKLRRSEAAAGKPRRPIDIPAVLTSAGATSAFATTYAAYALYGFLGPAAAFAALGAVAVATLLAAALHGPAVGALGLIGAYAAPFLVSSDEPNAWALLIYLLFPTAAAFGVGRLRGWPWLAIGAGGAAFLWGGLTIVGGFAGVAAPLLVYAAGLTAIAALAHSGTRAVATEAAAPDPYMSALIGLFGLLAACAPALDGFSAASLTGAGLILAGQLGLGIWAAGLAPVAPAAGVLAALTALSFDDFALAAVAEVTRLPDPGETVRSAGVASFMIFASAMGALFLAGGAAAGRTKPAEPGWRTGLIAAAASATPLLLLAAAYWRIAGFEPDFGFAGVGVLIAGVLAGLTEDSARREADGRASPAATAAYATGAAAALGLALAMAMREGALTVALAFLAMALGCVAAKRPIRALGWLAMVAAALVLVRIALDPRIVGDDLSATPVFNALLWGYGAPTLAFWLGAQQFAKARQAWPTAALEGLALVFALLLGFMQARHFAHGGDVSGPGVRLVEAGLDATVAFGLAAVAGRLSLGRVSPALGWGALAAGAVGLFVAVFALALGSNPLFTGESVGGGLVFNDLMLGYLAPALAAFAAAAFAAARFAGEGGPQQLRRGLGAAALALAFGYVTLATRFAFVGPVLDGPFEGDPEWYAYSVVWLIFGVALLAAGVVRRSQMLRLGSAIVIVAVILKVFLFDLSGIGGVWRALSFIGLGGVLVGVGFVYQRLLTPRPKPA